jgi:hypothetical protein
VQHRELAFGPLGALAPSRELSSQRVRLEHFQGQPNRGGNHLQPVALSSSIRVRHRADGQQPSDASGGEERQQQ